MSTPAANSLDAIIRCACVVDVLALKPGNVSFAANGHDMTALQFVHSAEVATPHLTNARLKLGESIYQSIAATRERVGCNTNLGIVLLLAPLVRACQQAGPSVSLPEAAADVLNKADVGDAESVFQAIRLAAPAGLGESSSQDVNTGATIPLKEVMRIAAVRDRIAFQYANNFVDVFEFGCPLLTHYAARWNSLVWAASALYLGFLTKFEDSHVVRKHGAAVAQSLQHEAAALERKMKACENPAAHTAELLQLDCELKKRGVNPGTSADLTVASVAALLLNAY